MPIQPNILERTLFYTLNQAPAPMLDLAGALAYQTLDTAMRMGLFEALEEGPATADELTQQLGIQPRGMKMLLQALQSLGYLDEQNSRYANSASTRKWLLGGEMMDIGATTLFWTATLRELWPHADSILQSGERPFDFYTWLEKDPALAQSFQQSLIGNARLVGDGVARKLKLPGTPLHILDVGGGHGMFSIILCQHYPQLRATILDSAAALRSAEPLIAEHQLESRIQLCPGDLWQEDWGRDYDLVLLFNMLHHYDLETNGRLLAKTAGALKTGGQVAVLDQIESKLNGKAIGAVVRLLALHYYMLADGRTFTREEMESMLSGGGFKDIRYNGLANSPLGNLITAVKTAI